MDNGFVSTYTKRIIPCLDVKDGRVVKGTNFVSLRDAGDPVELASFYDKERADELVFLDITASSDKRDTIVDVARGCASQVFIPFTIGGGIRTIEDMSRMLKAGADKTSLNTAAVKNPDLLRQGAEKFGSQCVVLAVDAKRNGENSWEVYVNGGRTPTGIDCLEWVRRAVELGAGEILLTSMDADGTTQVIYDINDGVKFTIEGEVTKVAEQSLDFANIKTNRSVSLPLFPSASCRRRTTFDFIHG